MAYAKTDYPYSHSVIQGYNPEKAKPFTPRRWQIKFHEDVLARFSVQDPKGHNYLCEAFPGGGKTSASLLVAKSMLDAGAIGQVVVVSPSAYLVQQWQDAAWEFGISLGTFATEPRTGRFRLSSDVCGIVATYAALMTNWHIFSDLGKSARTLVILDEIHHCGEEKEWGSSAIQAFWDGDSFQNFYRLSITGTPMRTDNDKIPFVLYDEEYVVKDDGTMAVQLKSHSDFTYSYYDALMDGVVREINFRMFDTDLTWQSNAPGHKGQTVCAKLTDSIDDVLDAERYRTAISIGSEFTWKMFTEAHTRLMSVRKSELHATAGGLVLVEDTDAAEIAADILKEITGKRPVVVHSNIPDAQQIIKKFKNSGVEWIVAVRMISEGVDIPRLRVGVFLPSVRTRLFFIQTIARIIRWMNGLPTHDNDKMPIGQFAYAFIPADPRTASYARELQKDLAHAIQERERRLANRDGDETKSEKPNSSYEWIDATAGIDVGEGHHQAWGYAEAHPEEYDELDKFKNNFGILRHATRGGIKGILDAARTSGSKWGNTDPGAESYYEQERDRVEASRKMIGEQANSWVEDTTPPAQRRKNMKGYIQKQINRIAAKLVNKRLLGDRYKQSLRSKGVNIDSSTEVRVPQILMGEISRSLYYVLSTLQGAKADKLTLEQIEARQKILASWEREIDAGRNPQIEIVCR